MSGNRSLDEFGGGEEANDEDRDATAAETGSDPPADDGDATPLAADVEPLLETYAWSAAGGACGVCGETVTTRWRDGETLVCADCKAW